MSEEINQLAAAYCKQLDACHAEIERLEKEVERLAKSWEAKHNYQVSASKDHADYFDKSQRRMQELRKELDTAWNDAIEAAATLCESKSSTPMDVKEPEYYKALGYELAAEAIRAMKRS